MFVALLRKLLGLNGSSTGDDGAKAPHPNSDPTRAIARHADGIFKDESTTMVAYDENLLERSRMQWQFGEWASLDKLDRDTLQNHPDRARLAMLAAAAHLQQGDAQAARQFTRLAQEWGCNKKLISQLLISGVYNSLGRAAAGSWQTQRAIRHFESAIEIGSAKNERRILARARIWSQLEQIRHSTVGINYPYLQANHLSHSRQTLLSEGYEACVYRCGDQVVKVYKSSYYQYNKDYGRMGEGLFLEAHPSQFFISLNQSNPFYIVMPYAGEPVGDLLELHHKGFNNEGFYTWLMGLKVELKRLSIMHRDINPSNILYHKDRNEFRLIDFGWAIGREEKSRATKTPLGMNPYGPSDEMAIEKMIVGTASHWRPTLTLDD